MLLHGGLAALYWHCLPHTVQGLDTGEFVSNAVTLSVVHPPGYPLFIWLLHAAVGALPAASVFWGAALLTAALATALLVGLGLLLRPWRAPLGAWLPTWLCCVAPLALSREFWAYAVRPDVFMLHALIAGALAAVYACMDPGPRRTPWLVGLFSLGLAHHLTVVFLAPLVLHGLWQDRAPRRALAVALVAAALVVGAYASLLWMHPGGLDAWGQLDSGRAVWRHFLRQDYGTWQLDGHAAGPRLGLQGGRAAARLLAALPLAAAIAAAGLVWPPLRRRPGGRRALGVGACLLVYLTVFMALTGAPAPNIIERFYVMPWVLLTLVALRLGPACLAALRPGLRHAVAGTAALVCAAALPDGLVHNALADETIVEDYAVNLLQMVDPGEAAVLVVDGDTRLYALRYAQRVLGVRPDVLVLGLGLALSPPLWRKVGAAHPELRLAAAPRPADARSLMARLVRPNLGRYAFYFARDAAPDDVRVTFKALGRRLSAGRGVAFDAASQGRLRRRSGPSRYAAERRWHELKDLYAEYAFYPLKLAQHSGDAAARRAAWAQAVAQVPYCFAAQRALCGAEAAAPARAACRAELAVAQNAEYNYF